VRFSGKMGQGNRTISSPRPWRQQPASAIACDGVFEYQGNQALRILHVIGDLAPASGGPAKAGFEMARALARRGHDMTIYTTDFGQPADAPRDQTRDGVGIRLFPLQAPRIWLASWPLRHALAHDLPEFDLLHLHSLYLFHDWAAGGLARRIAKPYLVRPHGSLDPYIHRRRRLKKAIFDLWFQNRVLAGAAAIHYTAEDEMRLAQPFVQGAPGVVIPNGLDPADYATLPPKGSFRARYPEIGDRQILLFLGRINFKKGLDILARAVGRLARKDLHLVIAGPDGGYLAETRRFIAEAGVVDRTTFTGMLAGEEKLAAFADAALFLLPSYSENFGIAVVEAMACGLPVLISDRVNIWREVVADRAGLAAPCDPAAFAERITTMLAEPATLATMGVAGRAAVARRYDWASIALRLEQVYGAIVAGRRDFG
jgi:glycosyltransferase involved in cell wall biosynthesis